MGLKSCVIGEGECDPKEADIICFNGFCSVHQLFTVEDVEFYREKYPDIQDCSPSLSVTHLLELVPEFVGLLTVPQTLIKYWLNFLPWTPRPTKGGPPVGGTGSNKL